MSEEIIYSNLKFQDSNKIENTQNLQNLGKKASVPSPLWRQSTLILTLLCLLLLIGLGTLGSVFYKTLKLERKKLNKLQNVKEELQRNVSLQLMDNVRSSEEIRNLSITLQIVATELCRELDRKKPGHKCKPCPKGWIWKEDSCHIQFPNYKTWQNAEILCSAHNASLLQVKNKKKLELIKSLELYNYWLGLSPSNNRNSKTLDDMIISSAWLKRNISDLNKKFCGFIYGSYVDYTYCSDKKYTVCEKMANSVNIESVLMSKVPDGRM
ncbi:C-type lectin domain family 12 member A isoform X2 [Sciurus carolinensis]|uniref:C-type lectin domain family 12 member A isoform X2 n=1 Tax=Sciurus carolinensis TaxID=30640 RepID=UPI001FB39172|nr:C-type lectin domain family 12 member A isoform X2 [Sciurus carolinensis]